MYTSLTKEQVSIALKRYYAGNKIGDICQDYRISIATFYYWGTKYPSQEMIEIRRLGGLEGENKRLKQLLAEKLLEIQVLKEFKQV